MPLSPRVDTMHKYDGQMKSRLPLQNYSFTVRTVAQKKTLFSDYKSEFSFII